MSDPVPSLPGAVPSPHGPVPQRTVPPRGAVPEGAVPPRGAASEGAVSHGAGPQGAGQSPVVVTPMRRRHLRSVLRIERHSPGHGWSLGLFMSELAQPSGRAYLVAKVDGTVVGFAGALLAADEAHVTTVAVDPAWRGRAVATRLVAVLVRRVIALGATGVTLEVRASNDAAIALYRRFGMAPVGVRAAYYADPQEDALVMWATEVDGPAYQQRLADIEASSPGATIIEEVGW